MQIYLYTYSQNKSNCPPPKKTRTFSIWQTDTHEFMIHECSDKADVSCLLFLEHLANMTEVKPRPIYSVTSLSIAFITAYD